MKRLSWLSILFLLIIVGCSKETEQIEESPEFPDPTQVVEGNLTGKVTGKQEEVGLQGISVDLLLDGQLLATTVTNASGDYSFNNQFFGNDQTVVRVHSTSHAPTYSSVAMEEGGSLVESFLIDNLDELNTYSAEAFVLKTDTGFSAEFLESSLAGQSSVRVGFKTYDLPGDSDLMDFSQGMNASGNIVPLNLDQAYALSIYNADGTTFLSETSSNFNVSLDNITGKSIWMYDQVSGMWQEVTEYDLRGDVARISTDQVTLYASMGSDCDEDVEPPVLICLQSVTMNLSVDTWLHATDIDNGSYDNCDEDLRLSFKKEVDACNGLPGYSLSQLFCDAESGQDIPCEMIATDSAGNTSSCSFNVSVIGDADCANDTDDPVPFCYASLSVSLSNGSAMVTPELIDAGSFDNCTAREDLVFAIRKQIDDCNNGSAVFGPSIEFCEAEKGKSIDVEMMITDEAGNGSIACLSTINIEGEGGPCAGDVMPPIAVVVSELEVSFSSKTTILPEDIDNFSYDLCSQDVLLKISKGTDVCANGSDQEMDSIELCSQEIGSDVIVVLTVYDEAGNSSTAWTKVSVVD